MAAIVDTENSVEEKVSEEMRVWKKNVPYEYDYMVTHALEWPSLTVQWMPHAIRPENGDHMFYRVLIGTHANEEQNHLIVAKVKMPVNDAVFDENKLDADRDEYGGYGAITAKIEPEIKINHTGEINRARYVPQYPQVIATKSPCCDVLLFDYTKHPSQPGADGTCRPELRLAGHTMEGYGLSWNKVNAGHLLSASYDKTVCLWDIEASSASDNTIFAKTIFRHHSGAVEDVCWHELHGDIFGSVGDDRRIMIWDVRSGGIDPAQNIAAHAGDINCISFNPFNEFILATGASDKTIALWDMRSFSKPLHLFKSHQNDIFKIEWSPHSESMFASSGTERNIYVWDAANIGKTQNDSKDGPPELLFVHGGHNNNVLDFSWNMCQKNTVCSVSEDNSLHIWEMADRFFTH